jgi:hypothetical protein
MSDCRFASQSVGIPNLFAAERQERGNVRTRTQPDVSQCKQNNAQFGTLLVTDQT